MFIAYFFLLFCDLSTAFILQFTYICYYRDNITQVDTVIKGSYTSADLDTQLVQLKHLEMESKAITKIPYKER